MKIVVFGSTGGVRQLVVRRAASAGHEVTAFLRSPEKLQTRQGVTIVEGDAFDADAVARAIDGVVAVISCLSSSAPMKPSTEVARMTQNIVAGMQRSGVDRIAYCASAGVDDELTGVIGRSMMLLLRNPLKDHRAAVKHIADAGLNATIARPSGLTDGAFDPDYAEAFTGMPAGMRSIPRASVADFLVKAIEQPEVYSRSSVGLALEKKA
ncbi:NAD(P)-dependent oxidoreductase [Microbacterium paludicola]|uniref:NAD(P)-dependent oxidoreductase n=1 Tax=Microbacterium paludicola TaxID=300019 RepID=UPI0011AA7084|nr:NAD(P)-binding oxidoreductase [Microbacterium paludicola]